MELRFTPEQDAFRQEIRDFLKQELPADWDPIGSSRALSPRQY